MKKKEKTKTNNAESQKERTWHFPFWGRMKINKKRTTLVIDETPAINKKLTKKNLDLFIAKLHIQQKKDLKK